MLSISERASGIENRGVVQTAGRPVGRQGCSTYLLTINE